jgi:leader peptidase (prepilin peptidase)/N-methyltransferase
MEILFIVLLGWLCGAFVNYLSDVLPVHRKLTKPFCLNCSQSQTFRNYFILPKRCHNCGSYRSLRVWIVEILFPIISVLLWRSTSVELAFLPSLMLMLFFGVVVIIDLEHRLIMHPVSWAGLVLCLSIGWELHGFWFTILGGVVGYVIMLGFFYLGGLFGRWLSHRRGEQLTEVPLGFGDVNLAGILGLLLGWPGILGGLFLAIILGGIVSLVFLLGLIVAGRYKAFSAIPYGPFLVASAVLLIYFKELISQIMY